MRTNQEGKVNKAGSAEGGRPNCSDLFRFRGSEKVQNKSSPNFFEILTRIFDRILLRIFRGFLAFVQGKRVQGKRRPLKLHQKSPSLLSVMKNGDHSKFTKNPLHFCPFMGKCLTDFCILGFFLQKEGSLSTPNRSGRGSTIQRKAAKG